MDFFRFISLVAFHAASANFIFSASAISRLSFLCCFVPSALQPSLPLRDFSRQVRPHELIHWVQLSRDGGFEAPVLGFTLCCLNRSFGIICLQLSSNLTMGSKTADGASSDKANLGFRDAANLVR